jgi:hypothetical protein
MRRLSSAGECVNLDASEREGISVIDELFHLVGASYSRQR